MEASLHQESALKRAALAYASRGWKVIPLHSIDDRGCTCAKGAACTSPGKHPRTMQGLKDASAEEGHIERWWNLFPDANVGIVTGPASGIVVVDVDVHHGGGHSMLALEAELGEIPDTMRCATGGGGYHIFLEYPAGRTIRNVQALDGKWQGVDVRGDGGYVVAAPSIHASGRRYEWHEDAFDGGLALTEIPSAWLEALAGGGKGRQGRGVAGASLPALSGPIAEGSRNQAMLSLGGTMRRKGMAEDAIAAALLVENGNRCVPPLDDDEVRAIARSVSRYEPDVHAAALDDVDTLEAARVLVRQLPEMLRGDPGAPFQRQMLQALAIVQADDPVEWERARVAMKKGGALVGSVKAEIKKRASIKERADLPVGDVDGAPIQLAMPPDFSCTDTGIYTIGEEGGTTRILPCPLYVTRRLKSIDTADEKVELSFRADGGWHRIVTARSTASTNQAIVSLADQGLPVTSANGAQVVRYIAELMATNADVIPLERCTERAGWIGAGRFFPGLADDVTFAPTDLSMVHAFRTAGDYAAWREGVQKVRLAHPLVRLQLAASFAAPLLKPLGHRNFILHLWGESGGGKTASLRCALSVWGSRSLMATFHATVLGLQNRAAMMCDVPYGINERQVGGKNLDHALYALCEGTGKVQGAKSGGNRQVLSWRSIMLTNGEEPLTRSQSMQGTKTRSIEIEGRPFATEDDAMALYDLVDAHYGHAGPAFVRELAEVTPEQLRTLYARMLEQLRPEADDRIETHVRAICLIAVADYLASRWVFGYEDRAQAWNEAISIGAYAVDGSVAKSDSDQATRVYDFVCNLVMGNPDRFQRGDFVPSPRWGFVHNGYAWLLTSVLEQELELAGHSYRGSLRALSLVDLLRHEVRGGKKRFGLRRAGGVYNALKLPESAAEGAKWPFLVGEVSSD